jgi:hypothetical protein
MGRASGGRGSVGRGVMSRQGNVSGRRRAVASLRLFVAAATLAGASTATLAAEEGATFWGAVLAPDDSRLPGAVVTPPTSRTSAIPSAPACACSTPGAAST